MHPYVLSERMWTIPYAYILLPLLLPISEALLPSDMGVIFLYRYSYIPFQSILVLL